MTKLTLPAYTSFPPHDRPTMSLPTEYTPAAQELLREIEESDKPLAQIARESEVRYEPLWKWVTGRQKNYSLLEGERVYHFLTGRTFLP